jgi:uncharacterized membrane protein YedE/YeeE
VLAFLDLAGDWQPDLALVMAAAIAMLLPIHRWALRRPAPLLAESFHWPSRTAVDRPLLIGALLFGIGWGIAGICPGPPLVGLVGGQPGMLVFVAAMAIGMLVQQRLPAS